MVMAEAGMAGIDGVGTALAVGAEMLAASDYGGIGSSGGAFGFGGDGWHVSSFKEVKSTK